MREREMSKIRRGGIERERIEAIKRGVDLVTLVKAKGVRLRKNGRSYFGLCPFHGDKNPSFSGRDASFGTSDNGPLSRRGFLFRLRRTKNLPSLPLLHNKHYVNLPETFYALQLSPHPPQADHLPALPEKGF